MTFGAECVKPQTGRTIDFAIKLNPPPPMSAVMTTAMNGAEVGRMVGASVASFDQVVSRVGAGLAAQVADAVVSGDDRRCQLSPRLSSIAAV
jgi:hypothetical protein